MTIADELEDAAEPVRFDWSNVDLYRLLRPTALRHVAGALIAALILLWPDRGELVLGRLIGVTLVAYGVIALWTTFTARPREWFRAPMSLAVIGLGGFFVVVPLETETAIARLLGALLMAKGAWDLLRLWRGDRGELGWRVASATAFIAVGLFVVAFPTTLLAITTFAIAGGWIAVELIALSVILNPARGEGEAAADTVALIGRWFADRPKTVDDRNLLYAELLYEGDQAQAKTIRFVMLMLFASVIASMGVIADSTAVVVGAMLIAPLMLPLMAMALSLVMGWPIRLGRSALVALGGIVLAIGVGFVIGSAEFTIVDTATNGQIVSRSNPTVVDLAIAVAAGAAGAYGLSRRDVANSLPGVAIAIALVPPLTVIGISYSEGDWDSGNGALLLFLTNALAILVVGGLMFLLLGVAPLSRATENQHRVRTASAMVAGATALIVGALVLNGATVATNVFEQRAAQRVVDGWIERFPNHSTVEITLSGDEVSVLLAGPLEDENPTAAELAELLSSELGRDISVDVRIRLELRETAP